MIIAAIIIFAILLFISMVSLSKPVLRNVISLIFAVLLSGAIFLVVANYHDHFGMKKVTTTSTTDLISVSPSSQMKLLLYQNVGTSGKNRVYIYKQHKVQKKSTVTNPDPTKTANKVKVITGTPKVTTKTVRWEYKNNAYKLWFGIANNDHKFIKRYNTFGINKDWLTLSSQQAKKLQKLVKANAAKMKQDGQTYVTAAVKTALTNALKQDPTLSTAQQQALTKATTAKATAAYQAQAMAKLVAQAKQ
ncbi:DUF4811 domain-containing protein [Loigolactobacillus binensis]|uniref:DUF4811 domain-containing protein n=1 Tax=Loigolactobacillus binensis TaxID=2559922 RepID=A0ABW3EDJ1_9LACO|nr:DUF4811 domain-containing protein [Loigolactobacillus binensis]